MTDTKHSLTEVRRNVKYGPNTIPLILQFPHQTCEDSCRNALNEEIPAILSKELSQFLSSEDPELTPLPQQNIRKAFL